MSRRIIEHAKTVLIAVLIVTAVLLAVRTGIFGEIAEGFNRVAASGDMTITNDHTMPIEAARPAVIALRTDTGFGSVAKYDRTAVDTLYERTSGVIGEALAAAADWQLTAEIDWQRALKAPHVMYEYFNAAPLELVSGWFGTSIAQDIPVRRICLALDDASTIYIQSDTSVFKAATESFEGALTLNIEPTHENIYEFEHNSGSAAPYHILYSSAVHPLAVISNPFERPGNLAAILTNFGIDSTQKPGYIESDGTQFYVVGTTFTLSISPNGELVYEKSSVADSTEIISTTQSVEVARSIAQRVLDAYSGDAQVWFSGISVSGNEATVTFDYYFAGGRVFLNDGEHAATVTIVNRTVTDMVLRFRTLTAEGETSLLPERQALAAADGEFRLGYNDSGSATPFWYSTEGGV